VHQGTTSKTEYSFAVIVTNGTGLSVWSEVANPRLPEGRRPRRFAI